MRRDIFHAIADPTRRAISTLIALQAMTPNAIAENFHTTRQAISKHLRILSISIYNESLERLERILDGFTQRMKMSLSNLENLLAPRKLSGLSKK